MGIVGGKIETKVGFTTHTFETSGTFSTDRELEVEAIVIGSGSNGVPVHGHGGEAGEMRIEKQRLTPASYAVFVGEAPKAGEDGGSSRFNKTLAFGGRGHGHETPNEHRAANGVVMIRYRTPVVATDDTEGE